MKISVRLIQKKGKGIGHLVNTFGSFVVGRKQIAVDQRVNSVLKWLKMFGCVGGEWQCICSKSKGLGEVLF